MRRRRKRSYPAHRVFVTRRSRSSSVPEERQDERQYKGKAKESRPAEAGDDCPNRITRECCDELRAAD
uniref:Uncharacterized protein n=1 Tax=Thermomicrobium roseum TaxID=500 RepID=A0A7C1JNA0_THERO